MSKKELPETDLLPFVRRATHAELLGMCPELTEDDLTPKVMTCDCGVVPQGQTCPFCGENRDTDAYPPWAALCAVNDVLAPEPPVAPVVDYSMTREERVERLVRRRRQHFGLWNQDDLINIDHASLIGESFERMAFTLSGFKELGSPLDDVDHEPLRNGAVVPGDIHLRKEAA
jgi:hypothetical protein